MYEPATMPGRIYRVEAPPPTDPDIIPSIYWIEIACDLAVERIGS